MRKKVLLAFLFLFFAVIASSLFLNPTSELSPVDIAPEELLVKTEEYYLIEIKETAPIIVDDRMIPRVSVVIKSRSFNKSLLNFTFKTPQAGYKFFSEGIFLYGYYSKWDAGLRSEAVFLDYNLTPKWWKVYEYNVSSYELLYFNPKTAQEYKNYILMLGSVTRGFDKIKGIIFFNKTNGEFVRIFPAEGFELLVVNEKAYMLSSRENEYYLTLYDLETGKSIKSIEANMEITPQPIDPFTGISIEFIGGENYFALFFSEILAGNGIYQKLCVYSLDLKLIDCVEFKSHNPQDKNRIAKAMFAGDYLILERNSRRKEVYRVCRD
ncbi:hypothetical protein ADU37_CDS19080 [Thermococcus sp. 2319x1]|uniref:hypothetical protein n=1 Tax=Thermococcus sp. 2319x1 TaxID=1674923 RepID=UPI00073A673E|nr:hypothetical protein [Thermococcus sp. 2319x1]ALV63607.1 hypothetical protein ADU37_CDS19080 [Thermococcus sp. 2319x1]